MLFLLLLPGRRCGSAARGSLHVSGPFVSPPAAARSSLAHRSCRTCATASRCGSATATNDQVVRTARGDRERRLLRRRARSGPVPQRAACPYLESDYVFALVGEELGLVGMWLVLGLLLALPVVRAAPRALDPRSLRRAVRLRPAALRRRCRRWCTCRSSPASRRPRA